MYKLTPAAYIFTHQYLNTMQQGIQSAHVVAELGLVEGEYRKDYEIWARYHKTLRILNAGSGEAFFDTYSRFKETCEEYDLASAFFIEPDLYERMTAFGFIITPEIITKVEEEEYDFKELYRGTVFPHGSVPPTLPILDFLSNLHSAK